MFDRKRPVISSPSMHGALRLDRLGGNSRALAILERRLGG